MVICSTETRCQLIFPAAVLTIGIAIKCHLIQTGASCFCIGKIEYYYMCGIDNPFQRISKCYALFKVFHCICRGLLLHAQRQYVDGRTSDLGIQRKWIPSATIQKSLFNQIPKQVWLSSALDS
uniref:Uncharacterized protein n=1 Tax=Ditylum brightwellii TaxID=49249 RepID=A0A7S2E9E0_9STRA|mmetsp:Transcript_19673/g.29349  ORF Transcript_19673/g.29349 Transcript_19673/m.29349 type:complete len:123 (+) Transcript_19673:647-1015(+)